MSLGRLIERNRAAILGITALLVGAGLYAASTLPIAIFPEVAFHRVSIIARAGELPVEQTSTALTQPLENALTGIVGVETIRSSTSRGATQIDVVFSWNTEMYRALQLVQAAMEEARGSLPAGTMMEARLLDTSAFPVLGLAVRSRDLTLGELSDRVIYEVAPRLRSVPGVYRVDLNGAKVREYALTVDPAALVAHRLELSAVEQAVREASIVGAAGLVRDGYQLSMTVVRGGGTTPEDLLDIAIPADGNTTVPLRAIARVDATLLEDFTRAAADGETAVLLGVSREPSANTLALSAAVHARVAEIARAHPEMEFTTFYDEGDLVREAVGSVRDSIGVGLVLAVATVFLFLADLWATAVAALVIPATVLIACLAFHVLGMSFNLMTLGGIAAGIGLILDDAIVVVENLYRHRLGEGRGTGSLASMGEIGSALVGSTLTPIAVLLPLALLGGVPGAFFRPLALTMSTALLVSLALALTFTPALASAWIGGAPGHRGLGDRLVLRLADAYGRLLRRALRRPAVVLAIGVLVCVGAVLIGRQVQTGFIPVMDEGAFVLDYWSPPGTSLEETQRMLEQVDALLQATPEVRSIARRTGAEMGFFVTESNRGDYSVRLRGGRRRSIDAIIEGLRARIHAQVPGLRIEFMQILQDVIGDLSGNPSPIEVKVFASDPLLLAATAVRVEERIAAVPGVVDTFSGITPIGATRRIDVDDPRARRIGLTAENIRHWIETATAGTVVGQVLEGDRALPLRLRFPDRFRSDARALGEITLIAPGGELAPLTALAHLGPGPEAMQRTREDLRPLARVTARLEERDLGSVMRDVQASLEGLALPSGVSLEIGGLHASQQAAFAELLLVSLGSVACVLALLLAEFGSPAAAFAVVLAALIAPSGSLLALWLSGIALDVSSIVGMIMVVGIVAKNGILLLDFALRQSVRICDLETSLIEAGRMRLRPILMTSLAAMAGLVPLALGLGAGSQMQRPLAIAILGGVSLSTIFSLFFVPVLYAAITRAVRSAADPLHATTAG